MDKKSSVSTSRSQEVIEEAMRCRRQPPVTTMLLSSCAAHNRKYRGHFLKLVQGLSLLLRPHLPALRHARRCENGTKETGPLHLIDVAANTGTAA